MKATDKQFNAIKSLCEYAGEDLPSNLDSLTIQEADREIQAKKRPSARWLLESLPPRLCP